MPAFESQGRVQDAVYWEKAGLDRYGQPTLKKPIPIKVKWNKSRRQSGGSTDESQSSTGELVVDRVMPIGSVIWLGKLKNYVSTETKYQVTANNETADIKGRNVHRTVSVARHTDTLPSIA